MFPEKHTETRSAHIEVISHDQKHKTLVFGPKESRLPCDDGWAQDAVDYYKLGRKCYQLFNTR